MPYGTKSENIAVNGIYLKIKSLADKSQYYDPDNEAEKLGITDSMWPISGLVWPSGVVLARIINRLDLTGISILEVGCGVAVASLIAAEKNADITASDYHPIVKKLLLDNAKENNLENIKYIHGDWKFPVSENGRFDLIMGSDLLYEPGNAEILSAYINGHLVENGRVILIDPGRRKAGKIKAQMEALGFQYETVKVDEQGVYKKNGYFTQYTFKK